MILSSSSFENLGEMPQQHGKKIDNVSPELSWENPPPGTQSFALAMVDTHPIARGYVHWLVVDIAADATSLPEGAATTGMPPGSRRVSPYAGPFPPSGTHTYEFTLYALDVPRLELAGKAALPQFLQAVRPHTLATATLSGTFTKVRESWRRR